jgi:hypothetical protein
MPALQNYGLAERLITIPATYKATSMRDGVSMLLQRRTLELENLETTGEELINSFQRFIFRPPKSDESQFLVISEKNLLYKTLDEKNRAVQKTLDVSGTWESTRAVLFDIELDVFRQALKRGVKIRWITESHEEDKATLRTLRWLMKNPLFEIRYFSPPIPLQAAIYDGQGVCMCIALLPSTDVTSIWSNNPMFVKVASNYFDEIWNGAVKEYTALPVKAVNRRMLAPSHK